MGQQCQNPNILAQHSITQSLHKLSIQTPLQKQSFPLPDIQQLSTAILQLRKKNTQPISLSLYHNNPQSKQQFIGYLQTNNIKQGYGELKTSQGKMYFGYFKDNLPHIKGVLIFSQGHYYIGQFINGKMHGRGKQVSPYFQFIGEYRNDMKLFGKLSTPQFNYEGQFKNNIFDGYGQLKFTNGQKYMGFFQNGEFNGQGIYLTQNQRIIYEGYFKNNQYHGKGKYYWEDGSYYEGQYLQGLKHGQGKYHKQGEDTIHGIWSQGSITQRIKNNDSRASTMIQNNRSTYSTKVQEVY